MELEAASRWEQIYREVPLAAVSTHYSGMIGSGYGALWFLLRGLRAEGIDYSPPIVERARQINSILGGNARFEAGDLFGRGVHRIARGEFLNDLTDFAGDDTI